VSRPPAGRAVFSHKQTIFSEEADYEAFRCTAPALNVVAGFASHFSVRTFFRAMEFPYGL